MAAVLLVAALSACGHADPAVSSSAKAALSADVARLQTAATHGSTTDLAKAADAVRAQIATQRAAGGVTADRAAALLDQLARVLADTAARPVPRVSPSTPAPAPSHAAPAPTTGKKKGHGKGEDKGD